MMGIATMTCDTTSGGVKIAAMKKITTIMTFLAFTNHWGLISPNPVKITDNTGNSKITPNIKNTELMNVMYS